MKPTKIILTLRSASISIFLMLSAPVFAQSNDWAPITGMGNLSRFMSGLTVERKLPSGELSTGEYHPDGTGVLISWGVSYPRTWRIEGDDQVCITAEKESQCYQYEQNRSDPELYRARVSSGDKWIEFRSTGERAVVTNPEQEAGSKGGAATPTAAEIATELSNPNTPMGTLNTNFDFINYNGDLPGAEEESALKIVFQPSLPYL